MIEIEQTTSIEHRGTVRGGSNSSARLHLHILAGDVKTLEEAKAIFASWDEQFSMSGQEEWTGWEYRVKSRREFALLPSIIRKAQRCGFDVAISQWDVGIKGKALLSADPADFWREIALAQMWYEK
jgi:hypothetical protein